MDVARLLGGEAEFGADPLVDVFGQGFGHLDGESVKIELVKVAILAEPLARRARSAAAHGDDLQADDIALAIADIAQEIGDTKATLLVLAGQGKARDLGSAVFPEQHDIVAVAGRAPVTVTRLRPQ